MTWFQPKLHTCSHVKAVMFGEVTVATVKNWRFAQGDDCLRQKAKTPCPEVYMSRYQAYDARGKIYVCGIDGSELIAPWHHLSSSGCSTMVIGLALENLHIAS